MAYTVSHDYVSITDRVRIDRTGESAVARYRRAGEFKVGYPGKLRVIQRAAFHVRTRSPDTGAPDDDGPGRDPIHGGWIVTERELPLRLTLKMPDGGVFDRDEILLADLARFRDVRGVSHGTWSYTLEGESEAIPLIADARVTAGDARAVISTVEAVASESAPLVDAALAAPGAHAYPFDLFHVGRLTASVKSLINPLLPHRPERRLRLVDPDGAVVATGMNGRLTYDVSLRTIDRSREADGRPRPWTLHIDATAAGGSGRPARVRASVVASARITTAVLQDRIDEILGPHGNKLSVYGDEHEGELRVRLKILDVHSAESLDMHNLLEKVIQKVPQDGGVSTTDIAANTAYTLAEVDADRLGYGTRFDLDGLRVDSIDIALGDSIKIQPSVPCLNVGVGVSGQIKLKLGPATIATAKVRGGRFNLEVGARLNPDGAFSVESSVPDNLIDVDVHWAVLLGVAAITGPLVALGVGGLTEKIESILNKTVAGAARDVFAGAVEQVPHVLMIVLGGHFTYRAFHFTDGALVFEYNAPIEPQPRPDENYKAVMGRAATQLGPTTWRFVPPSLGDTWANANLSRIDHIVMVMMENRSFDHVLGYRAGLPGVQDADGLTPELLAFLKSSGFDVGKLNQSGVKPNSFGFKTAFPAHVGHALTDVTQQLSQRLARPGASPINSPQGFLDNFAPKLAEHPELKLTDVLGYYEADDLPFFKYLVEHYAHCERYFCSHAGPTLPNRMFSLSGDVQHDRTGEAILDNNKGDNFTLSRALTIFDLLTRKGVDWRVYESFPSVSMLRMFARCAGDDTHIVPISRLRQDAATGNLPAVTVVEPAMHHYPQNDDHPNADMYRGQMFLQDVYEALRANEAAWQKTLLLITYDEHGGLYDHVIPPTAEVRTRPLEMTVDDGIAGPAPITPATVLTPYGVRVPTFVVSPWTPAGKEGPDIVLDHCSILKTVLARFCGAQKPFLSDRVHASRSFEPFLSEPVARMNVPTPEAVRPLPDDGQRSGRRGIDTPPLFRKAMRDGNADYHELTGRLARLLGRNTTTPVA